MKKQYKKVLFSMFMLSLVLGPALTFAAPVEKRERIKLQENAFCSRIDSIRSKFNEEINNKTAKFGDRKNNRFTSLQEKWDKRDEERNIHLENQDKRIQERYDALMYKADTDLKKEAVNKFKEDVASAISKRRESINEAVSLFREGISDLVNNKFTGIDGNVVTLTSGINSLISDAKFKCENGEDGVLIRTQIKDGIKHQYEEFRKGRSDLAIKADIEKLSEARKQAIAQAIAQFKTDMDNAQKALKLAFQ